MGAGSIHSMAALEGDLETEKNLASCLAVRMTITLAGLTTLSLVKGSRRFPAERRSRSSAAWTHASISTIGRDTDLQRAWITAWEQVPPHMPRVCIRTFMILAAPMFI